MCRSNFLPRRTDSVFCSGACRQTDYRERQATPRNQPPGFLRDKGWRIEMAEDFDAIPDDFKDYA